MIDSPLLTLVDPWTPQDDPVTLARTRIFDLLQRHWSSAVDPSRHGDFVHLRCPDWANVIALTPSDEVVLVEQFRFGIGRVTLEIPSGIVAENEPPAGTCVRELLEETGYAGDGVEIIGRVSANPAILSNYLHTGLIRDCRPAGSQALDEHEEIGVRLVPLADIPDLLRQGVIHHSLVVAAFQHLWVRGGLG
ncbi:MAG: NUDIX hydrolase [Acidimicrobiia bacterium]